MRIKISLVLFTFLAALFLFPSIAPGDDWNRLTTVEFNRPVQIPGQVLAAGFYVFKLAEITGEHNVVQIWNADQTILYATVMGFAEYLSAAPKKDLFIFEQTGIDKNKIVGRLRPTGLRPKSMDQIEDAGINLPPSVFGIGERGRY